MPAGAFGGDGEKYIQTPTGFVREADYGGSPPWMPSQAQAPVFVDRRQRVPEAYIVAETTVPNSYPTDVSAIFWPGGTDPRTVLSNPTRGQFVNLKDSFVNHLTLNWAFGSMSGNQFTFALRLQVRQDLWSTNDPLIWVRQNVIASGFDGANHSLTIPLHSSVYAFALYAATPSASLDDAFVNPIFS